jgi:aryl-alcohol dehydrogenase
VQTGAGALLNVLKPGAGDAIAVFGTGAVGVSGVLAAKAVGASKIIAIDINPERLEMAREFGATHVIDGRGGDVAAEILAITGHGVDRALDTTSNARVTEAAMRGLAPGGACCVVGTAPETIHVDARHLMLGGRKLMGALQGESRPKRFIPELLALYRAGRFPFDRMIKTYALDQINQAMHDAHAGHVLKPVLRMPH